MLKASLNPVQPDCVQNLMQKNPKADKLKSHLRTPKPGHFRGCQSDSCKTYISSFVYLGENIHYLPSFLPSLLLSTELLVLSICWFPVPLRQCVQVLLVTEVT